jgi:ribosomal protein S12 methylthiotransferase
LSKFFLDQHGCAKNQVDGETMLAYLENAGHAETRDPSEADVIIINTCGFIEATKKESLAALMQARKAYPAAKILFAGCLAQRYAGVFASELAEADGILGNSDLSAVAEAVSAVLAGKRPVIRVSVSAESAFAESAAPRARLLSLPGSAYVKISEGCDNRCSFCAIPPIRGKLRSRNAESVVGEIRTLLSRGVFEINLVGQDVAAFGTDRAAVPASSASPLTALISRISELTGDFWLRLLYIHPDRFPSDLLDAAAADRRVLPYFDIPFQSGDDRVIRAMNRRGSRAGYARLVGAIRERLPEAVFRTTFLAGFPGETEDEAAHTRDFLRDVAPDWSGVFAYSREEDTPAASMKPQVPKKTAAARAVKLIEVQEEITREKLAARVGSEYDVMVEEIIEGDEGYALGRAWFQAPEVDGAVVVRYDQLDGQAERAVKPGKMVRVKITESPAPSLSGNLVLAPRSVQPNVRFF